MAAEGPRRAGDGATASDYLRVPCGAPAGDPLGSSRTCSVQKNAEAFSYGRSRKALDAVDNSQPIG